jgi:hypothetical protein
MFSAELVEAENGLKTFKPQAASGLNPIEADLFFSPVQLGAIYVVNGIRHAVVNTIRFNQNETKDLNLAGDSVRVACLNLQGGAYSWGTPRRQTPAG